MIRFSRRSTRLETAVRILAIGIPVVTLLHQLNTRTSPWMSDYTQPLNRVVPAEMAGLADLSPGWPAVLLLALYLAAAAWIGWKALESLFPKLADNTHWLMRLSAGFIPGYLVVGAWNRLVSALLPNAMSPYVSLAGVLMAASYLAAHRGAALLSWKAIRKIRTTWPSEAFFGVFAILYVLVDGVQLSGHSLSGDGSERFVSYFSTLLGDPQPFARMPWIDQQYDELAFLHPIALILASPTIPVVTLFWMVGSLGRLSALGLVHFLARAAGLSGAHAFLLAAFLWLGTFSIYPLDYLILFDSHNPLFYNVHVGRIAADLMPLLAWLAVFSKPGSGPLHPRARTCLLGLLGAGTTALHFHAAGLTVLSALLALRIRRMDVNPALRALGTGWIIGALFAGNFLCALIWQKSGIVTSLWLPSREILNDPSLPFMVSTFHHSMAEFLRYFAVPMGLAAFGLVEGPKGLKDRIPVLLAISVFVLALAIVCFVPRDINAWQLTRLYEPAFYSLLFFSIVRLFQSRSDRVVLGLIILLMIYTFPVFFSSHRPSQWAENFTYGYKVMRSWPKDHSGSELHDKPPHTASPY